EFQGTVPGDIAKVSVRRQHREVVAETKLRQQRIDRADLNAAAAALVLNLNAAAAALVLNSAASTWSRWSGTSSGNAANRSRICVRSLGPEKPCRTSPVVMSS